MLDFLRNFIAQRGTQILARYLGMLFAALAANLGANIDTNGAAVPLASLAVAGLLWVLDHYSHAKQESNAGNAGGKQEP